LPKVLFAWWYLSIAIGFVLLAIRGEMVGEARWSTALQLAIAAGFGLLAWGTFRQVPPRR
jgi:hypothetical protein